MSKLERLKTMAERGGTENEREIARKLLSAIPTNNLPEIRSEESEDKWTQMGVITRHRKGVKIHLKGVAVQHFLKNIKDGQTITNRTIPLTDEVFGSGDFYTMISWLLKFGLATKLGSKYKIHSRKEIMLNWNSCIDAMKFKL